MKYKYKPITDEHKRLKELESLLRWEENWFHKVSQQVPCTRLVALRMMRHAIWYLRSRHRSADDLQAASLLLRCLLKIKDDSLRREGWQSGPL